MCNDLSDDIGAFPNLNNMDKNDIEGAIGTQLATSLNFFSTWMLIQPKKVLGVQKTLHWITEVTSKTTGTVCVMLEIDFFITVTY